MANQTRELPQVFREKVVVFDGAMGSLLAERGVSYSHPFEELNLSSPYLVCQVHADYIRVGADVIETNTFAANRYKLARHGMEDRLYDINCAGAKLARSVAGSGILVAGSIGPLAVSMAPIGSVTQEEAKSAVQEQLRGLLDGGIDLVVLETQTDLESACLILDVVVEGCGLPIICQFALGNDLTTPSGDTLDDITLRLMDYPISAVGLNCSIGPEQTLRGVQALREITDLPIAAQPSSGFPSRIDGRLLFTSGPAYFAERGREIVEAGATIVGGCCGTAPAHIEALAQAVKGMPKPAAAKVRPPRTREAAAPEICDRSPLIRKMNGDFITVEVTPPKDADISELLEKLRPLVAAGISAIDVTDNPMAHVHMSAIAFAHLIKEELGVATILHLTCRDLNLIGMHSALLGASALGIDGILALTGDPASVGDYPSATSVFDVTSDGLAKIINSLNCGIDFAGKPTGKPTSFAIGAAFNAMSDNLDKELERLRKKRESGANFLMTQPVFDLQVLENAVNQAPDGWKPPVLVGILPLRSSRHAEFLHNEVPGITIPRHIREMLAEVDPETAKAEGIRIARDIYKAAKSRFGGVYFMPPFNNYEVVRQVIAED